jgi:hypothetical protein
MYEGELLNNALTSGDEFANRSLLSIIGSGLEKSAEPRIMIIRNKKGIRKSMILTTCSRHSRQHFTIKVGERISK